MYIYIIKIVSNVYTFRVGGILYFQGFLGMRKHIFTVKKHIFTANKTHIYSLTYFKKHIFTVNFPM